MCLNCGVGFSEFTKNSGRTPDEHAKICDRPTARCVQPFGKRRWC
jgi:hypothetical protein